jgi:signal transduction histidine kinase
MMRLSKHVEQSYRRWRWLMLLFFIAMLLPSVILIYKAYDELKWEALHQQRQLAQALAERIDAELTQVIAEERQRRFEDYQFMQQITLQSPQQLSPLASLPPVSRLPGLLGFFQIDSKGRFTTPLLPENQILAKRWGIDDMQMAQRRKIRQQMLDLLAAASVVDAEPGIPKKDTGKIVAREKPASESVAAGAGVSNTQAFSRSVEEQRLSRLAFDNLVSRVEQKKRARVTSKKIPPKRKEEFSQAPPLAKLESNVVAETIAPAPVPAPNDEALSIKVFEKERESFQLFDMGNGYLVLYRQAWKNGERYFQGMILNQKVFVDKSIGMLFQASALADTGSLHVLNQEGLLASYAVDTRDVYMLEEDNLIGETLLQIRLAAPLDEWQLRFRVDRLATPAGSQLINWVAGGLLLVLIGGFYLMYRLGLRQIALISQQQDFVSAVSHELKTPLTSISMYSEMLREGWVDDERQNSYYDFIYFESQRLSRLIGNVLQFARLSRNYLHSEPKQISVGELMDAVASAVAAQVERAGFRLEFYCDESVRRQTLRVDVDHFMQIMINLVDNALKFSAKSEVCQLDMSCEQAGKNKLAFKLRDYGSGIEPGQMKKIFELFYRSENEMTRETAGTGIGLALVKELVSSMGGNISVCNASPGAEFQVTFPPVT